MHCTMIYVYISVLHYKFYINGWLKREFLKMILEIQGKCFYLESHIISNDLTIPLLKNKIIIKG